LASSARAGVNANAVVTNKTARNTLKGADNRRVRAQTAPAIP
jgi:hypothetical protein